MKTPITNPKKLFIPGMIFLVVGMQCCEPENHPPVANLEVTPLSAEVPAEIRMKLTGEDPDGVEDIQNYRQINIWFTSRFNEIIHVNDRRMNVIVKYYLKKKYSKEEIIHQIHRKVGFFFKICFR